jgi:hypothetical protein
MTLSVPVEKDGLYEITVYYVTGPEFATAQLSIDEKPLGQKCDTSSPTAWTRSRPYVIGKMQLTKGAHEFTFDLRYRQADPDDGYLHADKTGIKLINLPSGEACIVPYEGERPGEPSRTAGQIPVPLDDEVAVLSFAQDVNLLTDFSIDRDRNAYGIKETRCDEINPKKISCWINGVEDIWKKKVFGM